MSIRSRPMPRPLDPLKVRDPCLTAKGEPRASVALEALRTLWFNTGTLCNTAHIATSNRARATIGSCI